MLLSLPPAAANYTQINCSSRWPTTPAIDWRGNCYRILIGCILRLICSSHRLHIDLHCDKKKTHDLLLSDRPRQRWLLKRSGCLRIILLYYGETVSLWLLIYCVFPALWLLSSFPIHPTSSIHQCYISVVWRPWRALYVQGERNPRP